MYKRILLFLFFIHCYMSAFSPRDRRLYSMPSLTIKIALFLSFHTMIENVVHYLMYGNSASPLLRNLDGWENNGNTYTYRSPMRTQPYLPFFLTSVENPGPGLALAWSLTGDQLACNGLSAFLIAQLLYVGSHDISKGKISVEYTYRTFLKYTILLDVVWLVMMWTHKSFLAPVYSVNVPILPFLAAVFTLVRHAQNKLRDSRLPYSR